MSRRQQRRKASQRQAHQQGRKSRRNANERLQDSCRGNDSMGD